MTCALRTDIPAAPQIHSAAVACRRQHIFQFCNGHVTCRECGCLSPGYYCNARGICWECHWVLEAINIGRAHRQEERESKRVDKTGRLRLAMQWRARHKPVFAVRCGDLWPPMLTMKQRQARCFVEPLGD